MTATTENMQELYYDPKKPSSFGGIAPLSRAIKQKSKKHKVIDWLRTQDTYTLHRPARKRFPRNRYQVLRPNELWQADLNDMRGLSQYNDGVNYILTVIDVFSKRLFMVPLRKKTNTEIIDAFADIFKDSQPRCLQTDKGTEFTGKSVREFFAKHNVIYVTTQNPDVKAAVVERVNRTLKTRMWRYLTYKNTYRYVDVLDKLVDSYNRSPHRSLGAGLRPIDIKVGSDKVYRVLCHMYKTLPKRRKPKLKVGDTVRIAKEKGTFAKGYETNWSKEVFVVNKVNDSLPLPMYRLRDLKDKPLEGQFYEHEVQKVTLTPDRLYKIDKILETKGRGRSKRYLVKWEGYGDDFNSWVRAEDIENVQNK